LEDIRIFPKSIA